MDFPPALTTQVHMTYCVMCESSFSVRPRQGRVEPGDEEGRDEVGGEELEVGGVERAEAFTGCTITP
jgi:hypothetical protein